LVEKRPIIIPISDGFLADLTNSAWRIFTTDLADLKKIIWQRCVAEQPSQQLNLNSTAFQ
jgi:hypothetical protein